MKNPLFTFAIILALGSSTFAVQNSFAKALALSHSHLFSQQAIGWQTTQRILKQAAEQLEYSYSQLLDMYDGGLVTISETSEPNYYLVTIQTPDGAVDIFILDNL